MPAASSRSASSRALWSGARRTRSSCSFSAVSGDRNSCAASATNARCARSAAPRRASRPFSASTRGAISDGRPAASSPFSDSVSRALDGRDQAAKWRERQADKPPHCQRDDRRSDEYRHHAAAGSRRRQRLADGVWLRHADHAVARHGAVDAPGSTVDLGVREPDRQRGRQATVRMRRVGDAAVVGPYLDDVVEARIRKRRAVIVRDGALVAQRQCHLLQLVVE
jgi:hypothetical protein